VSHDYQPQGLDDCQARLALLSEYVEGLLDAHACAQLEAHLADCPDCRIVVNSLTNTIELYRRIPRVCLSDDADERLFRALQLRPPADSA
jgi:anti-sigma factor RsiW